MAKTEIQQIFFFKICIYVTLKGCIENQPKKTVKAGERPGDLATAEELGIWNASGYRLLGVKDAHESCDQIAVFQRMAMCGFS